MFKKPHAQHGFAVTRRALSSLAVSLDEEAARQTMLDNEDKMRIMKRLSRI